MRGNATLTITQWQGMVGLGGILERQHVWKLFTRESGDPVSSQAKGRRVVSMKERTRRIDAEANRESDGVIVCAGQCPDQEA
jgi:hypothetical protein